MLCAHMLEIPPSLHFGRLFYNMLVQLCSTEIAWVLATIKSLWCWSVLWEYDYSIFCFHTLLQNQHIHIDIFTHLYIVGSKSCASIYIGSALPLGRVPSKHIKQNETKCIALIWFLFARPVRLIFKQGELRVHSVDMIYFRAPSSFDV